MTVPDLITSVLSQIRNGFYAERTRDFMRDERQLTKAIARWGYECEQRGWDFTPDFIANELRQLLIKIKQTDADIGYMPVYLEGAVTRSIRMRAEELSAAAKARRTPAKLAQKIVNGVKVGDVREPTTVEVLAKVFTELKRQRRAKRKALKPVKEKQENLI